MFSTEFEQEVIKAVREIVKDILQDEIKQINDTTKKNYVKP